MLDEIIYFFRKRPSFFWSFIVVFAVLYGFLLWLYFLKHTNLYKDIFLVLLGLCGFWVILFVISFKKTRQEYKIEREKEKFELFREEIVRKYDLSKDANIFKKIEIISILVNDKFSSTSLASIKIINLINQTLSVYIKNLNTNAKLKQSLASSNSINKMHLVQQIHKNSENNASLMDCLDKYIDELSGNNKNEKESAFAEFELERTLKLIKQLNKG
ncbi:hypothetical protein [Campylobacter sp. VBCF_01 NA2]|uniref:hypothetical protein n=1 Tax=Campylobacter sp. VBCF_01 NA2 TaxID=2983836 RepID=UPI0022E9A1C2|nr:hypothetical protein [Campylobacter sp. VBCF_01 NA2]WBR54072.1 hypothetical protein PF027_07050 [Campylobacter sp. VBCF_01 NA2]